MGIELTDRQAFLISSLAYMDIDAFWEPRDNYKNKTLEEFALAVKEYTNVSDTDEEWKKVKYNGGYTHEEFLEIVDEIAQDPILKELRIVDYVNDNKDGNQHKNKEDDPQGITNFSYTGFVGIALQNERGNRVIGFRGSEGANQQKVEGAISPFLSKDWIENYRLGCCGSEQFFLAKEFVERNRSDNGEPTFVTGHSKGAALGIYVAGTLDNITGVVFDGPGVSQFFSEEQIKQLQKSGLKNYVAKGDIVGALLFHEEEVIYVETCPFEEKDGNRVQKIYYEDNYIDTKNEGKELTLDMENIKDVFHFHYLQAIAFDENGGVIPVEKSGNYPVAIGVLSQLLYNMNRDLAGEIGYRLDRYEQFQIGLRVIEKTIKTWQNGDTENMDIFLENAMKEWKKKGKRETYPPDKDKMQKYFLKR